MPSQEKLRIDSQPELVSGSGSGYCKNYNKISAFEALK
jgi:hypothetical protein